MIPMDTVKTRLVTQTAQAGVVPYKGVLRTLSRIVKEEGLGPIYRSLTPRLVSVVPMIGIQVRRECFLVRESCPLFPQASCLPALCIHACHGSRQTAGLVDIFVQSTSERASYLSAFLDCAATESNSVAASWTDFSRLRSMYSKSLRDG